MQDIFQLASMTENPSGRTSYLKLSLIFLLETGMIKKVYNNVYEIIPPFRMLRSIHETVLAHKKKISQTKQL